MTKPFRFKQFTISQEGCAMKVNTDGVLLGAYADASHAERVLDIGTGTGVVALMLAQRFPDLDIDALEPDQSASSTATLNFAQSPWQDRLMIYNATFQDYFKGKSRLAYDLIVSNPPFFIDALQSESAQKSLARHTDITFFHQLLSEAARHLSPHGKLQVIVPVELAMRLLVLAPGEELFLNQLMNIRSFEKSEPFRQLLTFSREETSHQHLDLYIYEAEKVYSDQYKQLLRDFLTIF